MPHADVFSSRAISDEVRDARKYTEYEAGDVAFIQSLEPTLSRNFLKKATTEPGWLMPKYAVPTGVQRPAMNPHVTAQLRPDKEVLWDEKPHDHSTLPPGTLERHIAGKYNYQHEGINMDEPHTHRKYAKYLLAPGKDEGRRLDHNPLTDFSGNERAFFVIEGALKNDTLVSTGEVVFNVPSVTLWNAPELERFARHFLKNRPVYIVPDSDWAENPEVNFHSTMCRRFLRELGVDAEVFAPTPHPAEVDKEGKPKKRGVDDFIADGNTPNDLVMQPRKVPPAFEVWKRIYSAKRKSQGAYAKSIKTDIDVMGALIELADREGKVKRHPRAIAKELGYEDGHNINCIYESFKRLRDEGGAFTEHEGSLDTWREYMIPYKPRKDAPKPTGRRRLIIRKPGGDFVEIVPWLLLREDLRPIWLPPVPLGEYEKNR